MNDSHPTLSYALRHPVVCLSICLILVISSSVSIFPVRFVSENRRPITAPTPQHAPDDLAIPAQPPLQLLTPGFVAPGTRPPSGWLYVLDPADNRGQESQILLIDPMQGRVMAVLRVGYAPEMVLSPDGRRLYVIATEHARSILSVIDTTSGRRVTTVDVPDRVLYPIRPLTPVMALSPDGRRLTILKMHMVAPGHDAYSVAVFDITLNRFQAVGDLGDDCGWGRVLPAPRGEQLSILCDQSADIRFLEVAPSGQLTVTARLSLTADGRGTGQAQTWSPGDAVSAVLSVDGQRMYIVDGYGHIQIIDITTRQIRQRVALPLPEGAWVPAQAVALAPDGTNLYVGIGQLAERSRRLMTGVLVVDPVTWQQRTRIHTSQPFWSYTASPDGRAIYAANPEDRSIVMIDPVTGRETGVISPLGARPAQVLVAP